MKLSLSKFTIENAKEICNWKYEGEYAIYNYPDYNKAFNERWAITVEEKRKNEFFSIINEYKGLCGYVRFQVKDNDILFGIGLKPSLCGQGFGNTVMGLIKEKCKELYPKKDIVLEVRTFNKRAIKCYEKAGFKEFDRYNKDTAIGFGEFIKMQFNNKSITK